MAHPLFAKARSVYANLKIRQKIILLSTASVLILVLIFLSFYGAVASRTVLKRADANAQDTLNRIQVYLDDVNRAVLERVDHLNTSISVDKKLRAAAAGDWSSAGQWPIHALLQDIQSADVIAEVDLFTPTGVLVETTRRGPEVPVLFRATMDQALMMPGQNYWADRQKNGATRTGTLYLYHAFCGGGVEPLGVACIQLSPEALSNMYYYIESATTTDLCLLTDKGALLTPWDISIPLLRVARDSLGDALSGTAQSDGLYGFEHSTYFVKHRSLPAYHLHAVSISPYSALMEDVHQLQMVIVVLGLVCILVEALFFSVFGKSLSRPLTELADTMEKLGKDTLDTRCNNPNRDEIGILAQNIDRMLDRIQNLMQENTEIEQRKHELELISLQTQITPHFLYNSLDNISALAQMGDSEGAFQMAQALGGFYRAVLSDGRNVISVAEEVRMTDSYLRVQAQRYQNGFRYEIDIPPEILQASMVKLSIQPLVENAIYHGIRNVRRPGHIRISARLEGEDILLSVWDNGKGIRDVQSPSAERREKGDLILHQKGYGMFNTDQRIKLYFGREYGLSVYSVPEEWTRVDIRMPYFPYKEYQDDLSINCR